VLSWLFIISLLCFVFVGYVLIEKTCNLNFFFAFFCSDGVKINLKKANGLKSLFPHRFLPFSLFFLFLINVLPVAAPRSPTLLKSRSPSQENCKKSTKW
jgi:hypothetical protein